MAAVHRYRQPITKRHLPQSGRSRAPPIASRHVDLSVIHVLRGTVDATSVTRRDVNVAPRQEPESRPACETTLVRQDEGCSSRGPWNIDAAARKYQLIQHAIPLRIDDADRNCGTSPPNDYDVP